MNCSESASVAAIAFQNGPTATVVRTLCGVCLLLITGCSWMGPAEASFFSGQKVFNRSQTRTYLGQSIMVNTQICPNNLNAGIFAINYTVGRVLNEPHYFEDSVVWCGFLITLTPCNLENDATANVNTFIGMYEITLRSCNLQSPGVL